MSTLSAFSMALTPFIFILTFGMLLSPVAALVHPSQIETEKTATAAIEEATTKLSSALEEVRRAEKAGAQVGGLASDLTAAQNHLELAISAKEKGQFATAVAEANLVIELSQTLELKAKKMKNEAEQTRLLQWVLIPLVTMGLTIAGILGWIWFKPRLDRRTEQKFLDCRIEY